jgi:hypothetical protein
MFAEWACLRGICCPSGLVSGAGVDNLRAAPPDQKTALGGVQLLAISAADVDWPTPDISWFSVREPRTSRETVNPRQLSPSAPREEES